MESTQREEQWTCKEYKEPAEKQVCIAQVLGVGVVSCIGGSQEEV